MLGLKTVILLHTCLYLKFKYRLISLYGIGPHLSSSLFIYSLKFQLMFFSNNLKLSIWVTLLLSQQHLCFNYFIYLTNHLSIYENAG